MPRMSLLLVMSCVGGCGGEFILTATDAVGLPGERAAVVVRLQRREFWLHAPPLSDAAITFRRPEGGLVAARTHKDGYSAVAVELPRRPGRYPLELHHQDTQGDTVSSRTELYVLAPDRPIVAVDLDSLPFGRGSAPRAAAALRRIEERAQILYVTGHRSDPCSVVHQRLAKAGYPDAAVVSCARGRPWQGPAVWGDEEGIALAALRQRLPLLRWGIAADDDSAELFQQAGLFVLAVKDASARRAAHVFFPTWSELRLPEASPGPPR